MDKITKDTLIGEILDAYPDSAQYFMGMGMHCLGCPSARGESVAQACNVHGIDSDEFVTLLNKLITK